MKKCLLVFFAILSLLSFNVHGQSKLTEQEVKSMLCHKWKVVSMEIQGKQISAGEEDFYITFLANGTFIDSQKSYQASKDKWSYTHSIMTITTAGVAKKIIEIDDKQLKIKSKVNGQTTIVTLRRTH